MNTPRIFVGFVTNPLVGDWIDNVGTVWCMGQDWDSLLSAFEEDLAGIYSSAADFAEEHFAEANPRLAYDMRNALVWDDVDWEKVWKGYESSTFTSADLPGTTDVAIFYVR
jgi:hypothetical protein